MSAFLVFMASNTINLSVDEKEEEKEEEEVEDEEEEAKTKDIENMSLHTSVRVS